MIIRGSRRKNGALFTFIVEFLKKMIDPISGKNAPREIGVDVNKEVEKAAGVTESEKHLAKLADRTFLDLWAYPNLYIDKMVGGQGKELCDLLVVCGRDVIIFSDKDIQWPDVSDISLAWSRWYKRAIKKSVDQVNGAARWISNFPDKIFLDRKCTQRLPLELPSRDEIRLHGIVVARGAGAASIDQFGGGTGSLVVTGHSLSSSKPGQPPFPPLHVGDVNPDGMFVHVLDDGSLDFVLKELDTITDFVDYIVKKEELIRSGHLHSAEGEEDLVAYYMTHMISSDEHGFPNPETDKPLKPGDSVSFERIYADLVRNPQYIAKKHADKVSYVWDELIRMFTQHILAGTTITHDGTDFKLSDHEVGVRYMAQASRFRRRVLGSGVLEAYELGKGEQRFARGLIPTPGREEKEAAFFFLTLELPPAEIGIVYERYREVRISILEAYAYSYLERFRNLPRIIGIGTEPPSEIDGESRGASEDLIVLEQPEWTAELLKDLAERKQQLDIMQGDNFSERPMQGEEWPVVETVEWEGPRPNRRQRRRAEALKRKEAKRKRKKS
jgi:hypothetical protein